VTAAPPGQRPRVLALVGPTGTGKSEIAAVLARRIGAEIISADSVQVYRGMDIGTAKPLPELRAEIPHHMIDVVEPDDAMSAGRYAELARRAARDALARGRPLLLCGGTGLYARAFAGGLIGAGDPDPELRASLRARPVEDLYRELRARDAQTAAAISAQDRVRIERALEIQLRSGRASSALRAAHAFGDRPFEVVWLGLELSAGELWPRIAQRVDAMFRAGLIDEVRGLLAAGYGRELRSMQAIGYREVCALLAGELDEAGARERIAVATRRYAKRQRTWFRAEPGLRWISARDRAQVVERALALLAEPSTQ
jgi:tRNA dimethylallyltransferase